ncbi:MAG: transposase [Desulfobacterales bacterium]|nr:transposase [Desulfobacterales bacterium]
MANETLLNCQNCNSVFTSQALRRLLAKHCNVAWDVVVFVGQSLFQHHRTTEQVRRDLQTRHVTLSSSEIEYLGRKFITYLALGHRQATPHIEQAMLQNGGYILHLDATHEADAPVLMTGMDGLSRFVLGNIKIPSEHADSIVPFLQQLKCDYGVPIACVHDMGTGILKAVVKVFPDTQDFICHFHFLRDVGKYLLNPAYGQLRKALRSHTAITNLNALIRQARQDIEKQSADTAWLAVAIKDGKNLGEIQQVSLISAYSLALWCLNGKKSGNGFGFPFDRPLLEFAQRLLVLNDYLPEVQEWLPDNDRIGNRIFSKLANNISDVVQDPAFAKSIQELQWRCQLFDDLRKKMRIAEPGSNKGLNDDGADLSMVNIQQGVQQFRSRLQTDQALVGDALYGKVSKQIDKYSNKLFADPIEINTSSGSMIIYPQRTNNMLEQFFRDLRRGHRRKTGNNSMRRVLQAMLADTPLVKNLDNPKYMGILLNGKNRLEELFAELEIHSCINRLID